MDPQFTVHWARSTSSWEKCPIHLCVPSIWCWQMSPEEWQGVLLHKLNEEGETKEDGKMKKVRERRNAPLSCHPPVSRD